MRKRTFSWRTEPKSNSLSQSTSCQTPLRVAASPVVGPELPAKLGVKGNVAPPSSE